MEPSCLCTHCKSTSKKGRQAKTYLCLLCGIYICSHLRPCRLTNTQYSMDELTAIVQEAAAAGTYVAAHAYTPPAITRALAAGVRSIEHGNWLDEDTAELMAGGA